VKQQKELPETTGRERWTAVFERTACINCHAIGGSSRQTDGSGPIYTLDESQHSRVRCGKQSPANLRAWIKSPDQFKPEC